MTHVRNSIGRDKAIELAESKWWEGCDHRKIATFQMLTEELCMPFGLFHEAVEKALGRPVFTHEFGLDYDGLVSELLGERNPPTLDEVLGLIPKDKMVVLLAANPSDDKPQAKEAKP